MTPDQITAYSGGFAVIFTASSTTIYRAASRSSRTIRKLRRLVELFADDNARVRDAAVAQGVPREKLPRLPKLLRRYYAAESDEDEGDADDGE